VSGLEIVRLLNGLVTDVDGVGENSIGRDNAFSCGIQELSLSVLTLLEEAEN